MKKIKILTGLLGIVCIILLIILFSLLREKKNNFNLLVYNELLNGMSYQIKYRLLNEYVGGGIGEGYWEKQVDSMYFYLDKIMYSNSYIDYCKNIHLFSESENKRVNNILKSLDGYNTEEKEFVITLLEYVSLQRMFEDRLSIYFPFDMIMSSNTVFPLKGDTISFGEEYVASIPFCGFNTEYQPILVLDGDTVKVFGGRNTFSEKATKRGFVKKEGYITYFQFGEEQRLPITVEYYVK